MKFKNLLIALAVSLLPLQSRAAFDIFLQLDGIPGESTDLQFRGSIELLSFSHAIASSPTGKPEHSNVAMVKTLDKSTPTLLLHANNGRAIKNATISFVRPTGNKQLFYRIVLSNVVITSIGTSGTAEGGEAVPMNDFAMSYSTISWEYIPINPATGVPENPIKSGWDVARNVALP